MNGLFSNEKMFQYAVPRFLPIVAVALCFAIFFREPRTLGTIAVVTLLMCLGKLYRYAQAKETDRRLREAHGDKYDALLAKLVDEQGIEALIDGHWAAPKIAAKRQLDG